jgi:hypothetical protein
MRCLTRTGLCLMVVFSMVAARTEPVQTDPYAIYDRAATYWDAASYPQSASYGVVIAVTRHSVVSTAHYHAYYDTSSNQVVLDAVSDEERAHPYVPHGINTRLNLFGGSIPLSSPQHTFDYLGVPLLAPNYSFGIARVPPHIAKTDSAELVREIRAEFHDPAPPRKQPAQKSGLKTIASVEVTHRHYVITLAGITTIGGHDDYDLRLKPISDPSVYRLRELWINADTFATDKLVTQGNFTADQLAGIPWTVMFVQIDGAPYIESEQSQSGFEFDRRIYDAASVTFTNIAARQIPSYAALSTFQTDVDTAPEVLREPANP